MIEVRQLCKTVKDKTILSNISFNIQKGDCLALIGPNGAGKTTLMSCLLGDRSFSKGDIEINHLHPSDGRLKELISVLPQDNVIPKKLKVNELLSFFRSICKNPLSNKDVDQILGFSDVQKKQFADKLSGGQKRLLAFALCLISQPEIILLDEPTAGMDTSTRLRFWEIVRKLKAKGVTIVYSSHYIEEVEHTADRILVLHKGKLIRDTTPFAMRSEEQEKYVTLPRKFLDVISNLPMIYDITVSSEIINCYTKEIDSVWEILQENGCHISEIEIQNKTLLNSLFDTIKDNKK